MFNAHTLGSNKSAFSGLKENPYFLVIGALIVGAVLRAIDRARSGNVSKGNTSQAAPQAVGV